MVIILVGEGVGSNGYGYGYSNKQKLLVANYDLLHCSLQLCLQLQLESRV